MLISFIVKATVMMVIPWYRMELDISLLPKNLVFFSYLNGKEESQQSIGEEDPIYLDLHKFLLTEKFGWRYDLDSYAPSKIFKGFEFNINCVANNGIIVNYRDKRGEWLQISKVATSPCPVDHL